MPKTENYQEELREAFEAMTNFCNYLDENIETFVDRFGKKVDWTKEPAVWDFYNARNKLTEVDEI